MHRFSKNLGAISKFLVQEWRNEAWSTNIRRHRTKFSPRGDLVPTICAPLHKNPAVHLSNIKNAVHTSRKTSVDAVQGNNHCCIVWNSLCTVYGNNSTVFLVRTGWNALNFRSSEHFYVRFRNYVALKQYEIRRIVVIGDSCSFSGDDTVKPCVLLGLPSFLINILVSSSL
jgi:hypothetical protein